MKKNTFLISTLVSIAIPIHAEIVDSITFGNLESERNHTLTEKYSEIIKGGLDESARILLPLNPISHNGGSISFKLNVDPDKQNYFTVKLWGSDCGEERGFNPLGENIHQAWKGEKLPIAKHTDDAKAPEYGKWGPFVGKASCYWLQYGNYFIALNTTDTNTYFITIPPEIKSKSAFDLASGKTLILEDKLRVNPLSTIVLNIQKNK
ncbi:MAG TPA: hypothetical protein P5239_06155 [Victivallales bacterium]|nr:hypothetical protein [Victivallales bacterium]